MRNVSEVIAVSQGLFVNRVKEEVLMESASSIAWSEISLRKLESAYRH